ncbi:MAG: cytochrome c [Candidatus Thiothrix singaporensis]|uniref:Cytochrome c n=1 Tax=Candidatus Thiothrix singaporensis TaxID=2799669 RepID=A0A7L6ARG8_9GAMM|nr:MAG: cytochrome c [Candidatus Thiothrix singaporensis]
MTLFSACQEKDTHPGQPVTKREHIFRESLRNFRAMTLMVQDKEPFSPQEFLEYAQQLKALSPQPWEHFPPGSDYSPSRALPAVWQQPEAFKQAQEKFMTAAGQLAEVAQSGDLARIRPAYDQVEESCSACHHDFRSVGGLL